MDVTHNYDEPELLTASSAIALLSFGLLGLRLLGFGLLGLRLLDLGLLGFGLLG